jgi:hypothetical protein
VRVHVRVHVRVRVHVLVHVACASGMCKWHVQVACASAMRVPCAVCMIARLRVETEAEQRQQARVAARAEQLHLVSSK